MESQREAATITLGKLFLKFSWMARASQAGGNCRRLLFEANLRHHTARNDGDGGMA
jgi:hypothetical protein